MKKFYVALVVSVLFSLSAFAQDHYWIGGASGDWNDIANWSPTSGGSAGTTFPQDDNDNAIFEGDAVVAVPTDNYSINAIRLTGAFEVVLSANGEVPEITLNSTSSGAPALVIPAGARLQIDAAGGGVFFIYFGDGAQGVIEGDWYFTGDLDNGSAALFELSFPTGINIEVRNGGSVTMGANNIEGIGNAGLVFENGSTLNLLNDGPVVPLATYEENSTILITGIQGVDVTYEAGLDYLGNLTYNCPGQVSSAISLFLNGMSIRGDLNILGTNNQGLSIVRPFSAFPSWETIVEGDLNIQGSSVVSLSHMDDDDVPSRLYVYGNVIMNGTSFSLQSENSLAATAVSTLHVRGNIQHLAGTFGASSTAVNESTHLFIVEMEGTTQQTISSHNGSFDNAANQVTLRINNAAGVVLNSSLAVGRIDFNTANKGILSTGANTFTINNTTASSTIIVTLPANPDEGFVNGMVRRAWTSDDPLLLPTGAGTAYRGVTVTPTSTTPSVFEARYYNTGSGDNSFVAPLLGIATGYYWEINRVGAGADASVTLPVHGPVPGATGAHALTVAKYIGSDWVNQYGPPSGVLLMPGDAVSGTVTSQEQTSFSLFTIGFGTEAALPVLLENFQARKVSDAAAELNWKISDNSTPDRFDILWSADGVTFSEIGSVPGASGKLSYTFRDNQLKTGNNYYRLRMVDIDGSATLSNIVVVMNGSSGVVISSMLPTIVRDRARLTVSASAKGNMQLVVTDIQGRIIQQQVVGITSGNQEVWLNLSRLSSGIFHVTGYMNGERTKTFRFIKQ